MTKTKNNENTKCWPECREPGSFIHCWWQCKMIKPLWKSFSLLKNKTYKCHMTLKLHFQVPVSGKKKLHSHTNLHTRL